MVMEDMVIEKHLTDVIEIKIWRLQYKLKFGGSKKITGNNKICHLQKSDRRKKLVFTKKLLLPSAKTNKKLTEIIFFLHSLIKMPATLPEFSVDTKKNVLKI